MTNRGRLAKIEHMLDLLDPDSEEYIKLSNEADEIADALNKVEDAWKKREADEKRAFEEKLERIRSLDKMGKTDQLVAEYGHEFIEDYHVDGNTITSKVARDNQPNQWTEDDVEAKLRQLLYYRIYDNYIRIRN